MKRLTPHTLQSILHTTLALHITHSASHTKRLALCLTLLLALLGHMAVAAQTFTLTGRVTDQNNAPVEFATVAVVSQGAMTMTNLKGEYSLHLLTEDSVVVRYSMVGYRTKTRTLRNPRGKQTLQIQLIEDSQLAEVTVTERKRQTGMTQDMDIEDTKLGPTTTGNAVEELIQQQAGVSTHSELSSQYNVRGGTFDENSVYINGVEVYRPFLVRSGQQEGLSIINADMVQAIGFSTGGFEAMYGDKMSSALSITYKRPQRLEGNVQASLLGGSAYVGFGNKRFSWSNGLRYKTNKNLVSTLDTKGEYDPRFLDYQTYMTYQPNDRWDLSLIGDISESRYNFYPEDRETSFGTQENLKTYKDNIDGQERDVFRTYFASLNITRNITPTTKLSLIASAFKTNEEETYDIEGQYWLTQTETSENLGVGTYMEHARTYLNATVKSL